MKQKEQSFQGFCMEAVDFLANLKFVNSMEKLRERINERTEEFWEAISFFDKQSLFALEGELYKRSLASNKHPELSD